MNQNRDCLLALVRGLDEHLVDQAFDSVQRIVRHAVQEELPSAPAEDVAADLIDSETYKGQLTVWGMFVRHYRPQRLAGKSPETSRLYRISVRHFSRWLGRPALLSDLTDDRVGAFVEYRVGVCASLNTAKKDAAQLLALWRYASARGLGPKPPLLREPDGHKPVPDCWTESELDRLIRHVRSRNTPMRNGTPENVFWESLLSFVLDTGERIGACLRVEVDQLGDDGWLYIPPTHRKYGKEGKKFKLSRTTLESLDKLAKYRESTRLFEWPYCPPYLWQKFGQVLTAAGLPKSRRDKFHKLRRTCATFYEAAGGDATKLLGHAARFVTDAYIDQRFISTPQPADINPQFFKKVSTDAPN